MTDPASGLPHTTDARDCSKGAGARKQTQLEDLEQESPPSRETLLRFHQNYYAATRKTRECGRYPLPIESGASGDVEVHQSEHGNAYFSGLQRCENPLRCAVCATRRALEDGKEIQAVLDAHMASGGDALLVTLTLPHHAGDALGNLMSIVQDAYRYTLEGREWRELGTELGYIGPLVKAREITVGINANGFHPHIHAILLFKRKVNGSAKQEVEEVLYDRWSRRIQEKHGRRAPSRQFGACVVKGRSAGEYVAKLGLGREVSSLAVKHGRGTEHLTPLQLLAALYERRDQPKGHRGNLEKLWEEYVRETKGKHLLTWGRTKRVRTLRDRAKVEEDGSLESEQDKPIAILSRRVWRLVLRQPNGRRQLLSEAERTGWSGIRDRVLEYARGSPWLKLEINEDRRRLDAYSRPGGKWAWWPKALDD